MITNYSKMLFVRMATLLTLGMGLTHCVEEATTVQLSVQVKTNVGDSVVGAVVVFDEKQIGETNAQGVFKTEIPLPVGHRARVEIKKESEIYYFAPYFESFSIAENSPQKEQIDAVLYFVPKPTPKNTTVAESDNSSIPASAPELKPADTEVETESSQVANAEIESEGDSQTADASPQEEDTSDAPDVGGEAEALTEKVEEPIAEVEPQEPAADPASEVKLTAVDTTSKSQSHIEEVYPKPGRKNKGKTIFTIHAFSGGKALADAEIYIGRESNSDLKVACTTNQRGRCVVRFEDKPNAPVTFVAKKRGYKTKSITSRVADQGQMRFILERGRTMDIFAITKSFNYTRGLPSVAVLINGKQVGTTDKYGYFSYVHTGKKDDLLSVVLRPKGFLPESFETDFVTSGPMTLVKYFSPRKPPAVRMTVLPMRAAGKLPKNASKSFSGEVDLNLQRAARKHIFSSMAFSEVAPIVFTRGAKKAGKTPTELMKSGWQETNLKANVDALLRPTLIMKGKPVIELSVVDSQGQTLAAAKESLDSITDAASVARAVAVIGKKITRAFPFEGAVLKKSADNVTLNLGYGSGRSIKPGDRLEVFGIQSDKLGRNQTQKKIGEVIVREVFDTSSKAKVSKLAPRSVIDRGDLVVLRPRKAPQISSYQIRVSGNVKGVSNSPISQANVYFNDHWIGATDEQGRIYSDLKGAGTIKVVKHGFQQYSKPITLKPKGKLTVRMRRETAFVRIATKPPGAAVKVEGRRIGKTPLSTPIPVPAGFVKVEIDAPPGYKDFSSVMELDEGTLDLTGVNEIQLEQDFREAAGRLITAGKIEQAVERLNKIPPSHSDYLIAQHEVGEIYLTRMNRPADAAAAFSKVTKSPAVSSFNDKRFIGSHINEGIALFMTAEQLQDQPEAAKAHYVKAVEVLEKVTPHLRFVPRDQYAQAVHNVDFYKALSRHKLWGYTEDPAVLSETVRSWKSYLEGSALSVPIEGTSKSYIENARVYYKQAKSSLAKPSELTR